MRTRRSSVPTQSTRAYTVSATVRRSKITRGMAQIVAWILYARIMRSILLYSAVRLALFALIWWLLSFTGIHWMFTGILAAVIAMLLSVLLLGRLRQSLALDMQEKIRTRNEKHRGHKSEADLDAEDEDRELEKHLLRNNPREEQ